MQFLKLSPWRSEKHRRIVASMPCLSCGLEGSTQCAHRNAGKGLGMKACDSQTFPLCVRCHSALDQGGKMDRETRRALELEYVSITRKILKARKWWSADAESAYQKVTPTSDELAGVDQCTKRSSEMTESIVLQNFRRGCK
jgi:hypothetical protein